MVQEGARVALTTRLTRRAGLPRRCQRGARREAKLRGDGSAPPAPASQDAPGDFICSKASASTKRRSSSDGALGEPEPRHPTPESLAMGALSDAGGLLQPPHRSSLPEGKMLCRQGGRGRAALALPDFLPPSIPPARRGWPGSPRRALRRLLPSRPLPGSADLPRKGGGLIRNTIIRNVPETRY